MEIDYLPDAIPTSLLSTWCPISSFSISMNVGSQVYHGEATCSVFFTLLLFFVPHLFFFRWFELSLPYIRPSCFAPSKRVFRWRDVFMFLESTMPRRRCPTSDIFSFIFMLYSSVHVRHVCLWSFIATIIRHLCGATAFASMARIAQMKMYKFLVRNRASGHTYMRIHANRREIAHWSHAQMDTHYMNMAQWFGSRLLLNTRQNDYVGVLTSVAWNE